MTKGYIHSIESMGLVDGPGIRAVVFMQGCSLRCKFCHNPDTWSFNGGTEYLADELLSKLIRFKPYFKNNRGGVTFSGGEPLMQPEFLLEILKKCKDNGINTCIDTAGVGKGNYAEILKYTDLVLYDIKDITKEGYLDLTGKNMDETNNFVNALKVSGVPVWIRHVVVPERNDSPQYMKELKRFIDENIPNVEKVELLPFHKLGSNKYKVMKIRDPFDSLPPMDVNITEEYNRRYFG